MGSNRAMFLFWFEVDGVNHSSFGKILTNLASFLTQFSSATDYRCFKFLHFFFAKNNESAIQESAFVESAINELLSLECILEVHATPVVMNPLSVSIQNSGKKKKKEKKKKKRLIFVLRLVDQYLFKYKFRCKDVFSCKGVLNPGNFVFF